MIIMRVCYEVAPSMLASVANSIPSSRYKLVVTGHMFPVIKIKGRYYAVELGTKEEKERKSLEVNLRNFNASGLYQVIYVRKAKNGQPFL